jgi:hypothetical protein
MYFALATKASNCELAILLKIGESAISMSIDLNLN